MDLDKFFEETDFSEAEKKAQSKSELKPEITDDDADCDGCKI